jgi:hypothetical protein
VTHKFEEHKEIWLQPWCDNCAMTEDRTWCQDNVWEDGCDGCERKAVRYVLAKTNNRENAAK